MGLKTEKFFSINIVSEKTSLADSSNYYLGAMVVYTTTSAGLCKIYPAISCKIRKAKISMTWDNGATTAEDVSVYVRVNNTSDTLIETNGLVGATQYQLFSNENLNIDLTTSDYFEIKVVTPAWVTNPTNARFGGYLLLSYE